MSGQWTDLVMAVRIIDKDITQVVDITQVIQVPRLSSRVLFLTREGMDGGMGGNDPMNSDDLAWILEQVLYIFVGTY